MRTPKKTASFAMPVTKWKKKGIETDPLVNNLPDDACA